MQQRYVGNSGLRVSALSLGTMSWARETDEQDASALLADLRGRRRHPDRHGRLLRRRPGRGDARRHAGRRRGPFRSGHFHQSGTVDVGRPPQRRHLTERDALRAGREPCPAGHRLRGHLVRPGLGSQCAAGGNPVRAGVRAVRSGRARYAGVSNFNGWQTAKAAAVAGFPARRQPVRILAAAPQRRRRTDPGRRGRRARPDGVGAAGPRRPDRQVPRAHPGGFPGGQPAAGQLCGAVPRGAGVQRRGGRGHGGEGTRPDAPGCVAELAAVPARRCHRRSSAPGHRCSSRRSWIRPWRRCRRRSRRRSKTFPTRPEAVRR